MRKKDFIITEFDQLFERCKKQQTKPLSKSVYTKIVCGVWGKSTKRERRPPPAVRREYKKLRRNKMTNKKYICMKCLHKIYQQEDKNLEYSKDKEQCCQCGKKTNYWYEEKPSIVKVGL